MATTAPATTAQSSGLCDYCHQRPKFANHSYCSKTCAGQAAGQAVTLCDNCHKKPKFHNFDYCGKSCAALAKSAGKTRNMGGSARQYSGRPNQNGTANASNQTALDPMQIAKLVAQHIPQVQAVLHSLNMNTAPLQQVQAVLSSLNIQPTAPTVPVTSQPSAPQPVEDPFADPVGAQIISSTQRHTSSLNNPFRRHDLTSGINSQPVKEEQASFSQQNGAAPPSSGQYAGPTFDSPLDASIQPLANDFECLIPGCGKPVQSDSQGLKTSDYCSPRHGEEAVATGYASPCIMCMVMPQSDRDYFCSRECRAESLNKAVAYAADEGLDS